MTRPKASSKTAPREIDSKSRRKRAALLRGIKKPSAQAQALRLLQQRLATLECAEKARADREARELLEHKTYLAKLHHLPMQSEAINPTAVATIAYHSINGGDSSPALDASASEARKCGECGVRNKRYWWPWR